MEKLRLKTCVVEGVKDGGQKDRRDDAECFFEAHPEKSVDEGHLEDPCYQDVRGAVEVLYGQYVMGHLVLQKDREKTCGKDQIDDEAEFGFTFRKSDFFRYFFTAFFYMQRNKYHTQTEDHEKIPE